MAIDLRTLGHRCNLAERLARAAIPENRTQPVAIGYTLDLGDKAAIDYSNTTLYDADGVMLTLTTATLSNQSTINTMIDFEGNSLSTLEFSLADQIGA